MKKSIKKIILIGALTLMGVVSLSTTVNASVGTIFVEKTYRMDQNWFTKQWMNKHAVTKIEVPSSASYTHNSYRLISTGINYERYEFTNYYESHLGFH